VTIDVPQELETVPGTVENPAEVDFYSREYPLESMVVTHTAVQEWSSSVLSQDDIEFRKIHAMMATPIVHAGWNSADIEPAWVPAPGKDVTEKISTKAKELGFGEAGGSSSSPSTHRAPSPTTAPSTQVPCRPLSLWSKGPFPRKLMVRQAHHERFMSLTLTRSS